LYDRIVTGDNSDFPTIAITLQKLSTIAKEAQIRNAVIFKDDCLLDQRKDPAKPRDYSPAAPEVLIRKIGANITWPVHGRNDPSHFFATLCFVDQVRARTVSYQEEA